MWWKNVAFGAICVTAVSAIAAWVAPRPPQAVEPVTQFHVAENDDLNQVVAQIDDAFARAWNEQGIEPAPPASDLTIVRRISLALIGSIPSLEEIRMFESLPPTERLVMWTERLLDDRRHADYFAERLARAYVGVEQGPFLIFRRRRFVSWLSDRLQENQPYDELVRALISAEGLWTDSPEVNFLTVNTDDELEGRPDPIRMAGRTTRAFLAVRLDCMQCHDDNLGGGWQQSDFHELAAFYAEPTPTFVGIRDKSREYETTYLEAVESTTVNPQVPFAKDVQRAGETRREQLAAWVTHSDNAAFSRAIINRVWAIAFGRPLVSPVDDIPLDGPYPPGLEILAADFSSHGHDLHRLWNIITRTNVFQAASETSDGVFPRQEAAWAAFPLTRLRPEQVAASTIQSGQLATIDAQSHILVRAARSIQVGEFVRRYGDLGQDEFNASGGTIPQRLVMLNGKLVKEVTGEDPITNASSRIAKLAVNDDSALDAMYLCGLSRRPTVEERDHFLTKLNQTQASRIEFFEDLHWTLLNSTEFSWNH